MNESVIVENILKIEKSFESNHKEFFINQKNLDKTFNDWLDNTFISIKAAIHTKSNVFIDLFDLSEIKKDNNQAPNPVLKDISNYEKKDLNPNDKLANHFKNQKNISLRDYKKLKRDFSGEYKKMPKINKPIEFIEADENEDCQAKFEQKMNGVQTSTENKLATIQKQLGKISEEKNEEVSKTSIILDYIESDKIENENKQNQLVSNKINSHQKNNNNNNIIHSTKKYSTEKNLETIRNENEYIPPNEKINPIHLNHFDNTKAFFTSNKESNQKINFYANQEKTACFNNLETPYFDKSTKQFFIKNDDSKQKIQDFTLRKLEENPEKSKIYDFLFKDSSIENSETKEKWKLGKQFNPLNININTKTTEKPGSVKINVQKKFQDEKNFKNNENYLQTNQKGQIINEINYNKKYFSQNSKLQSRITYCGEVLESYDLTDYSYSNSQDESETDEKNSKKIPKWANDEEFLFKLQKVKKTKNNILKVFGKIKISALDLNRIFNTTSMQYNERGDSANWKNDETLLSPEQKYDE